MAVDKRAAPVVLLALDAGDPDFILRWVEEGYLPTIGSIMRRGCWGVITDREQLSEWGTWTSLLGGISRSRHGFYYFRQLVPGTYDLRLFSPRDTGVQPFWAHLRGSGKKAAIIDPPESELVPGLSGLQLTDWATRYLPQREVQPAAEPAELLGEARRTFGPQIMVNDFSPHKSLDEDRAVYQQLLERVEKKGRLCRFLLAKDRFDLVVIGFYESHDAAHRFWDYRLEAQTNGHRPEADELTQAIRSVYQAIDRQMGLLLAELPSDANVFLLSCYGMEPLYPTTGLMDRFFPQLGYQGAPAAPAQSQQVRPLALLRRLVPHTWRAALYQQLPVQIQERLLAAQFRKGTNWQNTTAFAIPALFTSFVRVNLRGREPLGVITPGAEYSTLLDRLETDLQQLVDPHTGHPAVRQITRTVVAFPPHPPVVLPDLFVEWQPGAHFMRRLSHPHAELTQSAPSYFRGSYHSHRGFVAAAGPTIRAQGAIGAVPLLDLAPTCLALLGQPIPQTLLGKVNPAILPG
jgi:predicted AlkP superfamily phosphohydrolase/phosphomutase